MAAASAAAAAVELAQLAQLQAELVQSVSTSMARIDAILEGDPPPGGSRRPPAAARAMERPVYEAAPEAEVPRAHLTLAAALSQAQAPPRPQQPLAGGSGRSASDDAEVRFWQEKIAALSGPVAPADDPAAEEPGEDDEVKFWRQKIAALSRPIPGETGYDGGLEWSTQPGPLPAGSAMAFARQSMSASSSSSAGVASRPTAPVQGTHHEMPPRSGSQGVLSWTPSRPDLKSSRSSGSLLSSDVFLSNGLTGYGR